MNEVKSAYLEAKAAAQVASKNLTEAHKRLVDHLKKEAFLRWKEEGNLSKITSLRECDVRSTYFSLTDKEPHVIRLTFTNPDVTAAWKVYDVRYITFTIDDEHYRFDTIRNGPFKHRNKRPRELVNEVLEETMQAQRTYHEYARKRRECDLNPEKYIQ